MLEAGEIDLAGICRVILANSEWAELVRTGRYDALRPYDPQAAAAALEPA